MSSGIADELSGFINRSSLPSSGRPTDIIRTDQVKLSSLAANSPKIRTRGPLRVIAPIKVEGLLL
jgi:hypothetical protein